MGLNYIELITEVKVEIGKRTGVILATGTRIGRYVNWAQRAIVRKWPGLRSANVVDKTSVACVTDQCEYDLATLLADAPLAHIISVRYVDTVGANYRRILPFPGGIDWFDEVHPYPNAQASGIPEHYVRRGDTLELFPVPGASENAMPIWLEYSRMPYEMVVETIIAIKASPDGAVRTSNVVTITTTTAHGFSPGDRVRVVVTTVVGETSFDGDFVVVSTATSTTFTYAQTADDDTGGGGTATHMPLLTDFDEEIIQVAVWRALTLMSQTDDKLVKIAYAQGQTAWQLVDQRVEGENDFEEDDQIINE